ncbi:MAG TPA: tRNA (cytidine(34)-2'-O)-methyltransferase [Tepidisphaeraceae bacterium]|nr:tRNA (cytidine(34)-2'-O)-methyltransferase [Tepidisphaeraceae bacterium]
MPELPPHRLSVALFQPQIAPNTGNIARLCVATGTRLHLVRPMGFVLNDRELKRSAMDYWPRLQLTVHDDNDAFFRSMVDVRFWLFTSKATRAHWDAGFCDGDCLIFGSETAGLPESLLTLHSQNTLRIRQMPGERCLNLATAVGIGLYEALRQVGSASS